MRIRKPKSISKGQVVLVTVLGVFGGVYIWRPLFDDYFKKDLVTKPATAKTD